MSTQVQYRRGSNVQIAAFTGALGELVIDTTNKIVVVNDGATAGGFPQVGLTATQTLTNKTLSSVTMTGSATGSGSLSLTGNVTGAYILGNGSQLTGLSAFKIFNGSSEANIGVSNGNANISINGTSNVAVFASSGAYITGNLTTTNGSITRTGPITAPAWVTNGIGIISSANTYTDSTSSGTVSNFVAINAFGQPTLAASSATTWNAGAATVYIANSVASGTNSTLSAANTYALYVANGNVYFGANTNTSGNITGGNILTAGQVSATANVTGGNILTAGQVSAGGNVTGGNINTAGAMSASGTVTSGSGFTTPNTLTVNSNNNAAAIINGGSNGGGNIGSSTGYFNTVFAKATTAQYADLAEMYCADDSYAPGTVVEFGGNQEVTSTTNSHSTAIAGIISTNPSYLMNSTLACENAVEVALVGRVPCQVVGTIYKGDRLVSSGLHKGVATALDMNQYQPGCIIGKALENYSSTEVGTIEVAVGRI